MAKSAEIRELLESKEKRLNDIAKGNEMAYSLLVYGRVTRCKNGGAHQHKPIIRARQSRRYSGNDGIPNNLKAEALTLQNNLSQIMGDSQERLNNLKEGHGAIVSKRTIKEASRLTSEIHKLKSDAKDMTSGHQEPIIIEPKKFQLVKKPRDSHRGARGHKAYSNDATAMLGVMG